MNPSLPGLPIAVTASGVPPGAGLDIQTNQSDSEASNGFDGVLAQLVSGPAPVMQDAAAVPVDARQLFAGLQELPQGGKLLPLLQQTLDRVAASGIDLKKFVADLAAKLKVLSQDTTKDPAQQLALALQQLVQEQPALKPVLPADLLDAMAQGMTRSRDPLAIEAAPPGHSTLANVAHKACDRPADLQQSVQQSIQQAIQQSVARDAKPSALDTAWTQLQQTTALPDGGAADIAVLTAAFKRLLSDNRSASNNRRACWRRSRGARSPDRCAQYALWPGRLGPGAGRAHPVAGQSEGAGCAGQVESGQPGPHGSPYSDAERPGEYPVHVAPCPGTGGTGSRFAALARHVRGFRRSAGERGCVVGTIVRPAAAGCAGFIRAALEP